MLGALRDAWGGSRPGPVFGTGTNDNAPVGVVGEYVQAVVLTGSSISLTTATAANVTSISLTAGDWDVSGIVGFNAGGTTTIQYLLGGVTTTSATAPPTNQTFQFAEALTGGVDTIGPVPAVRFSLAVTTPIYLVAQAGFAVSTMNAYGTIRARRIR